MAQLLDAVKFLHDLGIVHAQICLDTVLVKSVKPFQIELGGFAKVVNHKNRPFTAVCCPPEIWEYRFRDGHGPRYWDKALCLHNYCTEGYRHQPSYKPVDIWCAGAVCSELTLHCAPHYIDEKRLSEDQCATYVAFIPAAHDPNPAQMDAVWAKKLGLLLESMSPALHSLLRKLLAPNPDARIRAEDCHKELFLDCGDCPERRSMEGNPQEGSQKRRKTSHDS